MALVRERRQPKVGLRLPEISRPRFPVLPVVPPKQSTTMALGELESVGVLGRGNGGTVYKVVHKKTSNVYALKVVQGDSDPMMRRQIFREMEILRRTDSPFVVECHEIFEKGDGDIAILMEYMDGGTLEEMKGGIREEKSLADIARQVVKGLSYLHAHKIIHRDIKPGNLLVNKNKMVKIADFGVSKIMCRTQLEACNSYVGTCAYMSPERFDPDTHGANYNGYSGDIWSLGLTMLELYLGHFPFLPPNTAHNKLDWPTLMCAICFGDPPTLTLTLPEGLVSDHFRSFIDCCLHKDSTKRWTASQLLLHPFIN